MATTKEYVDFCVEQLPTHYDIRYRKMFGEYMIYLNDKTRHQSLYVPVR